MPWRNRLKSIAERACVSSGLPTLSRRRRRRDTLILAYHNIVSDGKRADDCGSLHLARASFARQLDLLQETHDVVPLGTILEDRSGDQPRPRAVITFDDAYRGAVTAGIEEIVKRELSATIFVAPAYVGGRFFWWDLLTPAGAAEPDDRFRTHALGECRGDDDAVRRCAASWGYRLRDLHEDAACASEEELRAAAERPGITLASHSWSHPNLARLSATELDQELQRSVAWLRERFRALLPVIAYPYGLSSTAVERAAAAAGYTAGFLIAGGWLTLRARNPFAVPRVNVPAGVSQDGFLLRTAGLRLQ